MARDKNAKCDEYPEREEHTTSEDGQVAAAQRQAAGDHSRLFRPRRSALSMELRVLHLNHFIRVSRNQIAFPARWNVPSGATS